MIAGKVANYSALPAASGATGQLYIVLQDESTWWLNRKRAGIYTSDGSSWSRLGNLIVAHSDANFELFNQADNTKRIGVDLQQLTTGQLRTLTMPDADADLNEWHEKLQHFRGHLTQAQVDAATFSNGQFWYNTNARTWQGYQGNTMVDWSTALPTMFRRDQTVPTNSTSWVDYISKDVVMPVGGDYEIEVVFAGQHSVTTRDFRVRILINGTQPDGGIHQEEFKDSSASQVVSRIVECSHNLVIGQTYTIQVQFSTEDSSYPVTMLSASVSLTRVNLLAYP